MRPGFDPRVRKIPLSRKWHSAPEFLPGKFHAQRSLVGYSPWGCKESDGTEHTYVIQIILGTLKTTSTSTIIARHLRNLPSGKKKKKSLCKVAMEIRKTQAYSAVHDGMPGKIGRRN